MPITPELAEALRKIKTNALFCLKEIIAAKK